ncbi:putative virulence factor [Pseudomonas capsici]|uniref:Virulence factor n=1 Tax=Pseudomonas capsici TaxID=2810614 RepID=A0ABT3BU85_9PSED|nr:putative virulence factor [Pseudomonas capsici]MCV4266228.1 putative virulence factor [Pseudomonas capsici]MCV4277167.1 putative virulence factor [Pseudomonas capsici]MCV4330889.1 putative virulence factor [Pseudomonas capsici]MCV4376413.1 putative virulence factor [Pseudomonas capsici]
MTTLTTEQIKLAHEWTSVHKGAGLALDWVEDVAEKVEEVAAKAVTLNRDLHRARNLARSLGRVSTTPMGIGFFGLSQAGKSYLISALAADHKGQLLTQFGTQSLDFIKHVNPVGGGKEATGLVTRFTRRADPGKDPQFPVELRLFREVEIAIILANAWFEDFDHQRLNSQITDAHIDALLQRFEDHTATQPTPGVNSDDVVLLWDYLEHNYPNAVRPLNARYWQRVVKLAPRLSVRERAQLFSLLWGGINKMTETYEQLATALHRLGLAETVFAPITALVSQRDGQMVQTNSIINVDILSRLGGSGDSALEVRPAHEANLGTPVSVSRAELAALTNELIFRLDNEPANSIVNSVDLLDFPGYRSRQKLMSIDEASEVDSSGATNNPVAKLLLRGKVAYLFERYTNEQEMNALVMCTSSFKQSEVVSVGPVLRSWIDKTQGASAQERDGRASGLIWALTMCDGFIGGALNGEIVQFPESCDNMLKLTMIERFGNEEWMKQWGNTPFKNTYLVRKPRFKTSFIDLSADGEELGFNDSSRVALQALQEAFGNNELVKRHVAEPLDAWQAMLKLNDGGMSRFSNAFTPVANINFKLQRISEQLEDLMVKLLPRLEEYYEAGGEDERAKKKAIANLIVRPFATTKHGKYVLGELLAYMAVPEDQLRDLYLNGDFDSPTTEAIEAAPADSAPEVEYDIFGDAVTPAAEAPPVTVAVPQYQSHEHRFARAAFNLWATHLRGLSRRQHLLDQLELPSDAIALLVKELVVCAERLDLPLQLSQALLKRAQSGVRRENLVQRQVLTAQLLLDDFTAWFGHTAQPASQRPVGLLGAKQPLFSFYQKEMPGRFPLLAPQADDQSVIFADDWISGIAIHTQNNVGHRKGKEITPEQNEALGRVIQAFKAR